MTHDAETPSNPGSVPAREGSRGVRALSPRLMLVLALAAVLPFLPVLAQGFVSWDDDENFVENPDFGPLSWARARWAWATFRLGVYQPLAWVLLEAQAALFGLDGRAFHAVGLLLHAANALALAAL